MLLLLCRRRATRSGGGGAAEHDAINGISLRADRSSALALGPREKVRASQHKPARAASRPTSLCCVQIDRRDRNDGGAGGSAVEDDALSGFSSSADRESAGSAAARLCGRRSATDRRPRRCRHCAAPFPAPLCALGGSVAFRQLRAAAAAQLLPPQSRARAEQHSLLLLMSCLCVSAS